MKKRIFPIFILSCSTLFFNCQNQTKSCCGTDATSQFSQLGSDKKFQDAHPSPTKADSTHRGQLVSFPVENGANGSGYFVKANQPTDHFLLLLHEWWGLNDNTKNEADFWANELNINVLALDLYDGKVAKTADEAGKLMGANDKNRSAAIIKGGQKWAGEKADFRTMGWCFGGGWSLQAALLGGSKTRACVIYYGMPEEDVKKLSGLSGDVCGIFAKKDAWINAEVVSKFEKNMKAAGKNLTVHWYDADHAFANPSGPHYQEKEATEARAVAKAYLIGK